MSLIDNHREKIVDKQDGVCKRKPIYLCCGRHPESKGCDLGIGVRLLLKMKKKQKNGKESGEGVGLELSEGKRL